MAGRWAGKSAYWASRWVEYWVVPWDSYWVVLRADLLATLLAVRKVETKVALMVVKWDRVEQDCCLAARRDGMSADWMAAPMAVY